MQTIKKGLQATSTEKVLFTKTAAAAGSGDLQVYATPAMAALMENAAVKLTQPFLAEDESTVGIKLNITHERATAPGKTITATAELLGQEGRQLFFAVTAEDEEGIIGRGQHERFVINRTKFLAKLK